MLYPQSTFAPIASTSSAPIPIIPAYSLMDLAAAEEIWPQHKRYIYCTRTGQPWAAVPDEYVLDIILPMPIARAKSAIARTAIFGTPAPHWYQIDAQTLKRNKENDPRGMFVYLFNRLHHVDQADKHPHAISALSDVEFLTRWRWAVVELYERLAKIDPELVKKFNSMVLALSGEGYLPASALIPDQWCHPSRLLNSADLEGFYHWLRIWLGYRTGAKVKGFMAGDSTHYPNQTPKYDPALLVKMRNPNVIHRKALFESLGIEDYEMLPRDDILNAILNDADADLKAEMTKRQMKKLRERTGIVSPLNEELKAGAAKIAKAMAVKKITASTQTAVAAPGQMIEFNFGKKE